ncbi:MAG TPA: hypothetical protein RMH99_26200 [Sandaracinaceae bacterium LLY-WYZ-13_1]|nr:hypothetical protein [Sandaracinaceae bacterium LLY-WYZ-13_1]
MGLFDLFKKKSPLEKHGERVANKRAQAPDRWESIQALGKLATTEPAGGEPDEREAAIAALVERFTFYVDPSITDGEEKDEAFRWICEAGEISVKPVRAAARRHESLSWPLRMLEHLLPPERLIEEMIGILDRMDTEYERDPQRKLQLLSSLEERRSPRIAEAVAPFFMDVNEEARFHAVGAALAQENAEEVLPPLLEALAEEESLRVMGRALDTMAEHGWSLGAAKGDIELPEGYTTDKKGVPRKKKRK